uniref:Uncharacterized protein n=1 Tax=uncultured marine virus TaxID=186617 RepID=A0A0F7L8H6_9VIRU|nr:hypothetical protein [uncultured marine virus]
MTTAERTSRNIVRNYGRGALVWLLAHYETGDKSMSEMAAEFAKFNQGVPLTKQRINQWKHALGVSVTFYEVDHGVKGVLRDLC